MLRRYWLFFLVLSLLVLLVPACGGGGDGKTVAPTPTSTIGTTPTVTPVSSSSPTPTTQPQTSTPTSSTLVKIGAINSWSGPAALSGISIADPIIKLVEKQVKDQGGILGGRDVQIVRYDNRASVAEAQAGVTKLYYNDKVSAITMGGVSGAEYSAVAQACEDVQILYSSMAHVEDLSKYKFTVNATVQSDVNRAITIRFINEVLKPKTAACFGSDDSSAHSNIAAVSAALKAAGTDEVYNDFCPLATTDFSPYLTKIKYANPDVLYLYSGSNEVNIGVAKQMMELGGWGNIKVVATAAGEAAKAQPGGQGWYMFANWAPGIDYPGMTKFQNDFQSLLGRAPSSNMIYYYNSLWTAIYAIKLAGTDTDRVAIAHAARSGNLEWDTPMGHAKFQPDGTSGLSLIIEQIVNKAPVYVFGP
jgi:ABC-type branched-subunit amino acid transport system substrate-binding protein